MFTAHIWAHATIVVIIDLKQYVSFIAVHIAHIWALATYLCSEN